ncbi:MAG TPA: hypothetical protein PLU22_08665 [Polyangiaceae bacterium]|nr:hypothetical protein [Polyangiaceae bacterium]
MAASRLPLALLLACSSWLLACSVGEGEGWVRSDRLVIEDCWDGPFDLQPTFFGANPHREEEILIRVQRGNNIQELSDGLTVLVTDTPRIREELLGEPMAVGMPPGVTPPGVPLEAASSPPVVSLALYLHDTCHRENGTIYSVEPDQIETGELPSTITFLSLFSGDPNEKSAEDRLTEAEFAAWFADPRALDAEGRIPVDRASYVEGRFRFFFQRGQPAQPFP